MASIPLPALAVQPPQQDPLSSYAKAVQLKGLLQEQQLRQQLAPGQMQAQQQQIQAQGLENQQRQYQLSQTQAVNQAYRDALKVGSDGTPSIDTNSLSQSLAQSGHGEAIPGILKNTADYQKSMADAVKAQQDVQSSFNDALGNVGSAIQKANYDPNLADVLLQHQIQMPGIPPQYAQRLQQVDQQIRQNPQMVKQIADQLVATSSEQQKFQNALQVAGVRANTPDAQALAAFLRANPDKTAADFPAFKSQQEALAQNSPPVVQAKAQAAGAEAAAKQPYEINLAQQRAFAEQAVKNGSAQDAGKMLAAGVIAPSEVAARSNPSFLVEANKAAQAIDPNYNAQKAEADFNVAKSQSNAPFFGSAKSLTSPGGTLDQLQANYNKLGNTSIPLFNKVEDYVKYQAGNPAMAGFMQTAIGAADDYAKVMGGGTGTDSSRLQVLQSLSNAHNPEQMKAALDSARAAVNSQIESRIGNNKVLRNMYGEQQKPQFTVGQRVMIKGQQKTITAVHPDGSFDAN